MTFTEEWKNRVVEEEDELRNKIVKLQEFLAFRGDQADPYMHIQFDIMCSYLTVLSKRIEQWQS